MKLIQFVLKKKWLKNDGNITQNIIENEETRKELKKIKMFDSNGKIISFKPLKIDLFSKDFISPKNSVRIFRKRKNTIKKIKKI